MNTVNYLDFIPSKFMGRLISEHWIVVTVPVSYQFYGIPWKLDQHKSILLRWRRKKDVPLSIPFQHHSGSPSYSIKHEKDIQNGKSRNKIFFTDDMVIYRGYIPCHSTTYSQSNMKLISNYKEVAGYRTN